MQKNVLIAAAVFLVCLSLGVFALLVKDSSGTKQVTIGGQEITVPKNSTIELVSDSAAPSLTEPVAYMEDIPADFKKRVSARIDELRTHLTKESKDFNGWLDLALQYKAAGDIKAAERVWLFLTDAAPTQSISTHNLGTLYHLELKEYEKAEQYFSEALKREPKQVVNYLSFHELYRYSYKQDTSRAVDVLLQGIKETENPDLYLALGTYHRDTRRDTKKAIEYYLEARDALVEAGNTDAVKGVEEEIRRLKSQ
jgi:tetratricopeptide (TPR) repeat protein